jgi:hypothetical protein
MPKTKADKIIAAALNVGWVGCWLAAGTEALITNALRWETLAFVMMTGLILAGFSCAQFVIRYRPAHDPGPTMERAAPLFYGQGYTAGYAAGQSSDADDDTGPHPIPIGRAG